MKKNMSNNFLTCLLGSLILVSNCSANCTTGYFGDDCLQECHCNGEPNRCDEADGRCQSANCARGWTGFPLCQTMCAGGRFGLACMKTCHCPDGDGCHIINGLCDSGKCALGWAGPSCQIRDPHLTLAPEVTAITGSSVSLEWPAWDAHTHIGDGPVASYTLQLRREVDASWQDRIVIPETGKEHYTYTASQLAPATGYIFRIVLARYFAGKSQDSSMASPEAIAYTSQATTKPFVAVTTTKKPQINVIVTELQIPKPPLSTIFWIAQKQDTEIFLSWIEGVDPAMYNLQDIADEMTISMMETYQTNGNFGNPIVKVDSHHLRIQNLKPATQYRYDVTILIADGTITSVSEIFWTPPPDPPDLYRPQITASNVTNATVKLTIKEELQSSFLPLLSYQLVVEKLGEGQESQLQSALQPIGYRRRVQRSTGTVLTFLGIKEARDLGLSYYITAQLPSSLVNGSEVVIGNNSTIGAYLNTELEPDRKYYVWFVGVTSLDGITKYVYIHANVILQTQALGVAVAATGGRGSLIAGLVVFFLLSLIAVVVVLLLLWWRRRQLERYSLYSDIMSYHRGETLTDEYNKSKRREMTLELHSTLCDSLTTQPEDGSQEYMKKTVLGNYNNNNNHAKKTNPILVKELHYYFDQREKSDTALGEEFKFLPTGFLDSTNVASMPQNHMLNRNPTIIPYDRNRVKLIKKTEDDNPYINASFLRALTEMVYIVTQCPLPHTTNNFWQMVWEQDIVVIVCLMDFQEPGKPIQEPYWPSVGRGQLCHDITVDQIIKERTAHYIVREMELSRVGWQQKQTVLHYQFLSWTPGGIPYHPILFVDFVRRIQEDHPGLTDSLVVHCHTGSGRSGVYVAVDSLLSQGKKSGRVDPLKCVSVLRMERPGLVKTLKQYRFIHECLTEAFDHRDTRIRQDRFPFECDHLLGRESGSEGQRMSLLAGEFADLLPKPHPAALGPKPSSSFRDYSLFISPSKRRPRNRVLEYAESEVSEPERMEITFLDAYLNKDTFIVSQSPDVYEDCEEFWKVVYENCCHSIVMLNRATPTTRMPYWPDKLGAKALFGPYTVTNEGFRQSNSGFIMMVLTLRYGLNKSKPREIHQYELDNWTGDREVPAVESMLDLLMTVRRWTTSKAKHRPVMVHSALGKARPAVFAILWTLLERLDLEDQLDIFTTTRYIRTYVPTGVSTLTQYRFIYRVIKEHVKRQELAELSSCPLIAMEDLKTTEQTNQTKAKSVENPQTKTVYYERMV